MSTLSVGLMSLIPKENQLKYAGLYYLLKAINGTL